MSTKEIVLKALESHRDDSISGQGLAKELGVSRTAVWKAINSLKEEGHDIESIPGGGYRLLSQSDIITKQSIDLYLDDELKNIDVHIFDSIDSTNNFAKKLASEESKPFSLIIANEQTSGRGRYGKDFYSPSKSGIYMSLLIRSNSNAQNSQLITIFTAVSICQSIKELTGMEPKVKWVNDIFLKDLKVCGILTEAIVDFESGRAESIIIGIGINFKTPESSFPDEIKNIAGAIDFSGIQRSQLIADITNRIYKILPPIFESNPNQSQKELIQETLEEYRRLSFILGKELSYTLPGEEIINGIAIGINDNGNLLVQRKCGHIDILSSGEVSIRPATDSTKNTNQKGE